MEAKDRIRFKKYAAEDSSGCVPGKKTKGEKNGRALLTEPQVLSILRQHKQGASQRSLAREFGVSPGLIHLIVHRKRWAHLEV